MNNLERRNFTIERLKNAVDTGLCNTTILQLACEVAFYANEVDWEIRHVIDRPVPQQGHHVTEQTMTDLLLRPHIK